MKTTFVIVMLALVLASCEVIPTAPNNGNQTAAPTGKLSGEIPAAAMAKYRHQLELEYKDSLGAGIDQCVSKQPPTGELVDANGTVIGVVHYAPELPIIYRVWGSGGYTGVGFYYAADGTSLGSDTWSDAITGNEPAPPLNISEYTCTPVESSKSN